MKPSDLAASTTDFAEALLWQLMSTVLSSSAAIWLFSGANLEEHERDNQAYQQLS
jgi:hypothetical protein